jgi:hypothetical protein
MEKQLSTIGYWLGLICTVLALIFRIFLAFEINPPLCVLLAALPFPTWVSLTVPRCFSY